MKSPSAVVGDKYIVTGRCGDGTTEDGGSVDAVSTDDDDDDDAGRGG